eukprot:gene742-7471_t
MLGKELTFVLVAVHVQLSIPQEASSPHQQNQAAPFSTLPSSCRMLLFDAKAAPCPVHTSRPGMFEERKSKLCRPDYFVGGVRKGGTTALHTYISKHPEVFPFKVDQPHHTGEAIFSSMNKLDAGTTAYNRQFGRIPDNLLVGDASAHRLVDAKGGFFRDTCPGSKMFILLRDPVERLLSNIKMRLRSRKKHKKSKDKGPTYDQKKLKKLDVQTIGEGVRFLVWADYRSFIRTLEKGGMQVAPGGLVGDSRTLAEEARRWRRPSKWKSATNVFYEGLYSVHLQHLLQTGKVANENLRIYWSEDMFRDPQSVVQDAWSFLGLKPPTNLEWNSGEGFAPVNSAGSTQVNVTFSEEEFGRMYKLFAPFDAELERILGLPVPWKEKSSKYIGSLDS